MTGAHPVTVAPLVFLPTWRHREVEGRHLGIRKVAWS